MNKYAVRVTNHEPVSDYGPETHVVTIEADSFLITAHGDLKFNMKVGGTVEAYAAHEWSSVRRVEDDGNTEENQGTPEVPDLD